MSILKRIGGFFDAMDKKLSKEPAPGVQNIIQEKPVIVQPAQSVKTEAKINITGREAAGILAKSIKDTTLRGVVTVLDTSPMDIVRGVRNQTRSVGTKVRLYALAKAADALLPKETKAVKAEEPAAVSETHTVLQ